MSEIDINTGADVGGDVDGDQEYDTESHSIGDDPILHHSEALKIGNEVNETQLDAIIDEVEAQMAEEKEKEQVKEKGMIY